MPEEVKPKTRDQVMLNVAILGDDIESTMLKFSKLFPEFSLDWLIGIDSNYNQFLDYLSGAIKQHEKNKLSK